MSEKTKDAIWRLNDIKRAYPLDKSDEWAVDMAIAALSAEPCSDAISRAEALEKIAAADITNGEEPVFTGKQVQALLKGLPFVHVNPCEDTISREIVLRELDKYLCGVPSEKCIYEIIKDLPSVHAEPRTGQSKLIPSGLKLKIEREADYQNERVNADIARGMYLALEIIDKWEADHA